MKRHFAFLVAVLPLTMLGLGGCGWSEPYIFKANEFNRETEDFGKEVTDRDSVQICYSKRGTKPEVVRQMAEAECGRFGKVAVFQKQDILNCPVATPARASFLCLEPQAASQYLNRR